MRDILKDSYGVFTYQEQIMWACTRLAGFTMVEADRVRKVVATTSNEAPKYDIEDYRERFVSGCEENGYGAHLAEIVWKQIKALATYCFNKAHAVSYGVISWQEAYIKARWPAEYLCACLNDVLRKGWRDRYERFVEDARNHNIEVIPPCVNRSRAECFVNDDGAIVLGLSMVKGVGKSGSKAQENAPYKSYRDFVLRSGMATADTVKSVKRSLRGELFGDDGLIIGGEGCIDDTTLSMIHGGCFDQAHPRRAILEECHPTADVTAAQKREAPVSIFERKWVVGPPRREGYALMRERGGDVESTIPVKVKRRPGTVQNRPGGYDIDTPAYVDASLLDRGCSTEHLVSETIVTGFQGPSVSGGDFVVDDKELWSRACEAWLIGHETRARILFKRAMSIRALRKADAIEGEHLMKRRPLDVPAYPEVGDRIPGTAWKCVMHEGRLQWRNAGDPPTYVPVAPVPPL